MTLTLTMLRCPDAVYPETREVTGGELRIGRGPDNDWVLADPERHLSKRHCIVAFHMGGWAVADISTNGTFVNDGQAPLGHGKIRDLRDGDRIRLGTYEIEARIIIPAVQPSSGVAAHPDPAPDLPPEPDAAPQVGAGPLADPFTDALFAPGPVTPGGVKDNAFVYEAFGSADPLFGGSPLPAPVILPDDFSTPPPRSDFVDQSATADHTPAFANAFTPPPSRVFLPDGDDWDLAPLPAAPLDGMLGGAPEGMPDGTPHARPQGMAHETPDMPPAAWAGTPGKAFPPGAPVQDNPFVEAADRPFPAPVADLPGTPSGDLPAPQGAAAARQALPSVAPPGPPQAPQPHIPPSPAPGMPDLMQAFLAGAGLAAMPPPDNPRALMEALGATFRAMVSGMRQVLIARATIKGEFRIEQTMIRAQGNNPLKFSAHDEDALCALLGLGRRVDMRPDVAVADTLRDMRLHELATMAAMQEAVRAVVARLEPARIRAQAEENGGMALLPAQKKARAFDSFEKEYKTVAGGLTDSFDAVFGQVFARAYETALHDINQRGTA